MRNSVIALALLSTVAVTTAASADVLIAGVEIGEKNFTDERVFVVTARYLCPGSPYEVDNAGALVEQYFGDFVVTARKALDDRITCDGTWNRVRVRFRKGEDSDGDSRRFTPRLPITITVGFGLHNPSPESHWVFAADQETVLVQ